MDNREQACGTCGRDGYCGVCGSGRNYMGNHLLKWFLGIIIITWIFTIGMKMGEFKAQIEMMSPYGNHMMLRATPASFSVAGMPAMASAAVVPAMVSGKVSAVGGENVTFTTAGTAATPVMKTIQFSN